MYFAIKYKTIFLENKDRAKRKFLRFRNLQEFENCLIGKNNNDNFVIFRFKTHFSQ